MGECVKAAVYLINRTPSKLHNGKTPYERLYGRPPSFNHIRIFGCLAYAHNKDHKGDKFASRSRRCMFLGYPSGKKGWILYDLERESIFTSRDVAFCEDQFPFVTSTILAALVPLIDPPLLVISHDDASRSTEPAVNPPPPENASADPQPTVHVTTPATVTTVPAPT